MSHKRNCRPRVSAMFKEPPAGQQMEYGGSEGLECMSGKWKIPGTGSTRRWEVEVEIVAYNFSMDVYFFYDLSDDLDPD